MKILIIGGTIFLGRHITEAALNSGHQITLFNRGKHNPDLFDTRVKTINGDRENISDLEKLTLENYDTVIDTCAYLPSTVLKSAQILKKSCSQYVFISTISVYHDEKQAGIDEDYPLSQMPESADCSKVTNETYGAQKALCEETVRSVFAESSLIIRPGYIIGPYDQFDRHICWLAEAFKNRSMLCPGDGNSSMQFIDVRDLSEWIISLTKNRVTGTYNATGEKMTFLEFVTECCKNAGNIHPIKFVSLDIIEKDDLWSSFPVYLPNKDSFAGYCQTSINKAKAAGLTFRPYSETFKDIYHWHQSKGCDYQLRDGLTDEVYGKLIQVI